MEGTWTCPQCETLNENADMCIVCGMNYDQAILIYKTNSQKVTEKTKNNTKVDPSKITLRFNNDEESPTSVEEQSNISYVSAICSIVIAVVGILIGLYTQPLGWILSIASIILGSISLGSKISPIAFVGMFLGISCLVVNILSTVLVGI